MATVVDTLYVEHSAITQMLGKAGEPSLVVAIGDNYRKALVLACASFFEHTITEALTEFIAKATAGDERIVSVFKKKAIDRQYFTYFDWEKSNCNKFFTSFGEAFKTRMRKAADDDEELEKGERAFLELGRLRNELVHRNFATFAVEKTADEIYSLYKQAVIFVDRVRVEFGSDPIVAPEPQPEASPAQTQTTSVGAPDSADAASALPMAAEPVAVAMPGDEAAEPGPVDDLKKAETS